MYRPFRRTSSVLGVLIAILMAAIAVSAQAQGANKGCYQPSRLKGAGPVRLATWPNVQKTSVPWQVSAVGLWAVCQLARLLPFHRTQEPSIVEKEFGGYQL